VKGGTITPEYSLLAAMVELGHQLNTECKLHF